MKTIREWLEELPDGYRELALANVDEGYADYPISGCESDLSSAILRAFDWSVAPEPEGFWDQFHCHFAFGDPLPKLPSWKSTDHGPTQALPDKDAESAPESLLDEIALSIMLAKINNIHKDHEIGDDKIRQCYETAKRVMEIRKEFV